MLHPTTANSRTTIDMIWHLRLGHASPDKLKQLSISNNKICVKNSHICPLAKQTRLAFPINRTCALELFSLVHLDV